MYYNNNNLLLACFHFKQKLMYTFSTWCIYDSYGIMHKNITYLFDSYVLHNLTALQYQLVKQQRSIRRGKKPSMPDCYEARREPQWGPGNHYRGALSQPHSVCAEIEMCPLVCTIRL